MQQSIFPITRKSFNAMCERWSTVIDNHESCSLINFSSRTQNYRVVQFLEENEFIYKDIQFIIINVESQVFETAASFREYLVSKNDKKKKRKVFFILHADGLLDIHKELLDVLNEYAFDSFRNSLFYFFTNNFTYSWNVKTISQFGSLFQNIYFERIYEESDIYAFIDYSEAKLQCGVPLPLRKEIVTLSGGRLWLASELVRTYSKERALVISPDLKRKVGIIWSEFLGVEQEALKKIVSGIKTFNLQEQEAILYLQKINCVSSRRNKLSIRGKVLTDFIRDLCNVEQKKVEINNGLEVNGVNVTSLFTVREFRILTYLSKHASEVVLRDEVGNLFWNSGEFTDWALDQAIRRIRLKFKSLGVHRNLIKSVRGKGYMYVK
ncbi:MAG: helix-turn-helix domain-containing protein [Patescibacteria group bacterium]